MTETLAEGTTAGEGASPARPHHHSPEGSHQARQEGETPAQARRSRALLLVAVVFFWSAVYLYVPTLAPYAEHLGASLGLVGLIVSAYGFSQLVLRIPVGLLSDRWGRRKPFIVAAFVASTGAALWFALTGAPAGVLAARAMSGVSATMWVVITVMFASYYPPSQAGYAMSLITFVTTLSQLASTLGGGLIAEKWGWQAPFVAAVGAGILGLLVTIPLKEGRASQIGVNASELLKVGTEKGLLIVSGLAILFHFNSYITIFGFVPNYAVAIGATKAQLGYLSLVSTLPNALAALGTGKLFAKRWTERQMVVTGFVMMALSTWMITMSDDIRVLYATQALGGFGRGLIFPVLMGLSIRTVAPERRATAMGFFQSIYALGMFAGPAVSGVIAARSGLAVTFNATAWITIIAAVAAAWLMPKPLPSKPEGDLA